MKNSSDLLMETDVFELEGNVYIKKGCIISPRDEGSRLPSIYLNFDPDKPGFLFVMATQALHLARLFAKL